MFREKIEPKGSGTKKLIPVDKFEGLVTKAKRMVISSGGMKSENWRF